MIFSQKRAWMLVIAVVIAAVFLPVLTAPYGLTDDYLYLAHADDLGLPSPPHAKDIVHAAAAEGRPFWALVEQPVLSAADTIDNLRFVRIITVAGIAALALLLYWSLVRAKVAQLPAALLALLVCAMPPFQLYAGWTVAFPAPWAALLAGGGSLLTAAAVAGPRRLQLDRLVGATVLLIVAALTYQPAAMFFWVFLAVALVGSIPDSALAVRLARAHALVAAVALALAYVGYKIGVWLVGSDAPGAERGALVHDIWGKATWFVRWPLYMTLNLFDMTLSVWAAVVVALVAAGGIALWLVRRTTRPLLYGGLAAILVPLTILPNLVVEETYDWLAYRPLIALSAIVALYFGLGALALWVTLREWLEGRVGNRAVTVSQGVATALAAAFVATSLVLANRNVDDLIAEPQRNELRVLRSQVAALPDPVRKVAFVLSGPGEVNPDFHDSDEFGMPSTAPWYTAEPLVLLLLREQGRLTAPPVVDELPWYAESTQKGSSVVNLNGLLQRRDG